MKMDAEDLQRMNRVLRHQLRNFASGVKNAVTLLEYELAGRLQAESEEYFPLIKDECLQLFLLTERLGLLFDADCPERVAARESGPPRTVESILEGVLKQTRAEFPTADIHVEPGGALAEAVAGGGALALALREVVRNAVEASRAARVVIRCGRQDGDLCVRVEDSGPGLGAEPAARIFAPFHTTRSKHAGIGLSIASEVLAERGGGMSAETNPGGGMAVTLRIPAQNGEHR